MKTRMYTRSMLKSMGEFRLCRVPGYNAPPRQPGVAYPCEDAHVEDVGQGPSDKAKRKRVSLQKFSWDLE